MIEIDDLGPGVVRVRLAHGRANALDLEMCEALTDALRGLAADDRAVVLTGAGSIFCAGVDLKRLLAEDDAWLEGFLAALRDAFAAALDHPRPLIAAINGHAIAGGCVLAAACDQRLMAAGKGRIGVPELLVGVPFPALALEVVRSLVAPHVLQRLVWRGETLDPEGARAVGLVDDVVDAEFLEARAAELAATLGQLPARTFALTRSQLRAPQRNLLASLARHDREVVEAWKTPEIRNRIELWVARTMGSR